MRFGQGLLELLFPSKCPFCGALLGKGAELCGDCQKKLAWLEGSAAETKVEFVSRCVSPLIYDQLTRQAMHRYKFEGVFQYKKTLGKFMAQCVQDQFSEGFDLITWVPLHRERLAARGYDQAKLLALEVGAHCNIETTVALEKLRRTAAQSGIDKDEERRANVLDSYRLKNGVSVEGKRILLVDDVVTTGATMAEAARVLRMAAATEICAVTLAKARK